MIGKSALCVYNTLYKGREKTKKEEHKEEEEEEEEDMNANKLFINALPQIREETRKELFRFADEPRGRRRKSNAEPRGIERFWGLMSKKLREKMGIEIRRINK